MKGEASVSRYYREKLLERVWSASKLNSIAADCTISNIGGTAAAEEAQTVHKVKALHSRTELVLRRSVAAEVVPRIRSRPA